MRKASLLPVSTHHERKSKMKITIKKRIMRKIRSKRRTDATAAGNPTLTLNFSPNPLPTPNPTPNLSLDSRALLRI